MQLKHIMSNDVAKKLLYVLQAPNAASDPQQRIHRITSNFPDTPVSPFHENDPLRPLARLEIKRISPKPGQPLVCSGDDDEDYDVDEFGKDIYARNTSTVPVRPCFNHNHTYRDIYGASI